MWKQVERPRQTQAPVKKAEKTTLSSLRISSSEQLRKNAPTPRKAMQPNGDIQDSISVIKTVVMKILDDGVVTKHMGPDIASFRVNAENTFDAIPKRW